MHSVEETEYGIRISVPTIVPGPMTARWEERLREIILSLKRPFAILADLRQIELLPPDLRSAIVGIQRFAREHGLVRSVIVLTDRVTLLQLRDIAREAGITDSERYIDASRDPDWEEAALDWILDGVEPDAHEEPEEARSNVSAD